MKKSKSLLSVILCVLLVISTMPLNVFALYRAPGDLAVDSAIIELNNGYANFFSNDNSGSGADMNRSYALFTLARALAEGNTDTNVKNIYVSTVRKLITNLNHMPSINAGLDARSQFGAVAAIAIGWNLPDIKSQFSTSEQNAIMILAKACIVASAYVYADYDSSGNLRALQRTAMNGDTNTYTSPNYSNGIMGLFFSGAAIYGKVNVPNFLDTYSHSSFKAELQNNGLTVVYNCFNTTTNSTVESIVNYIVNNDNASSVKPFYKGKTLANFNWDPLDMYCEMVRDCFSETATEGDYIGQVGRGREFNTTDADGLRDSMIYSSLGMENNILLRYVVENAGWWSASTQSTKKNEIDAKQKTGFSDLLGKATNGYWSHKRGVDEWDFFRYGTYGMHFNPYFQDVAQAMQKIKIDYYNDSFEDGDYAGWSILNGSFIVALTPTWSGSTTQNINVLQTYSTTAYGRIRAGYTASNYDYYVKVKPNGWGTGGNQYFGIFARSSADGKNAYVVQYNKTTQELELIKRSNDSDSILARVSNPLNTGTVYNLRLSLNGSTITLYVDGVQKLSTTDTTYTSGYLGVYSKYVNTMFEDILVTGNSEGMDSEVPKWVSGTLSATNITSNSLTLNWSGASDNDGIRSYKVYKDGAFLARVISSTSYNVTGLTDGKSYTFKIEAGDNSGNFTAVGPSTTAATPDVTSPAWTLGSLTTASVSSTTLTLNWSGAGDNVGVTQYKIYKDGALLTTVGNVTTYNVAGLKGLTTYTFKVEAGDAAGNFSATGPSTSVTTNHCPTIPQNLRVTSKTSTSVTLAWDASVDELNDLNTYKIKYGLTGSMTTYKDITGTPPVTTVTITGLLANTSYSFQVRALDAAGYGSAYGNMVTTTTNP